MENKVAKIVNAVTTLIDAVAVAGEIPSGHLYAQLMPYGVKLDVYQKLEELMLESGKVRKECDLLIAVKEGK